MAEVYILHSGYVTTDSSKLLRSTVEDKGVRKLMVQPSVMGEDLDGYYDSEVTAVFSQWRKDESMLRSFEFREVLIKAAMRAFSEKNFIDWISLQTSQGCVGYLHRRFLQEMAGYIFHKKAKTMDNYQYYRLLSREPYSVKFPDTGVSNGFSRDYLEQLQRTTGGCGDTSTAAVLARWTQDVDGICDLICSLNVIFGRRVAGIVKISAT